MKTSNKHILQSRLTNNKFWIHSFIPNIYITPTAAQSRLLFNSARGPSMAEKGSFEMSIIRFRMDPEEQGQHQWQPVPEAGVQPLRRNKTQLQIRNNLPWKHSKNSSDSLHELTAKTAIGKLSYCVAPNTANASEGSFLSRNSEIKKWSCQILDVFRSKIMHSCLSISCLPHRSDILRSSS